MCQTADNGMHPTATRLVSQEYYYATKGNDEPLAGPLAMLESAPDVLT
jgi:hypothetical protein